jgi:hypothetical protein
MSNLNKTVWRHGGFDDFSKGEFENGGANLYATAKGSIETVHRTGLLNNGCVDIVLPNSHGYNERGPTRIYTQSDGRSWSATELPNDSGWMSQAVDIDGDGYLDLVVVNGENGVTSELDSYVYWGGPDGLTGERVELPTTGAYDVAIVDVNGDGRLDLIFPSAWVDHHNQGKPLPLRVYVQTGPRRFEERTDEYGLIGVGAASAACADLNGNGKNDLVVANYREKFEYDTESFVYWGTDTGFDPDNPLRLPTHYALQALTADLNGDGRDEIIFAGGNQVWIYWNHDGSFGPENRTILESTGFTSMFSIGAVRAHVADVDGDGVVELLVATEAGVEIRRTDDLTQVAQLLDIPYSTWVATADLDGDGRPEIVASKYDDRVSYDTQSAIFWNGPDGFSNENRTLLDTGGAMGCTAADLDGDGRAEVIFNNTMGGPSQFWPDLPIYVYYGGSEFDYGAHRRLELPSGGCTYVYVMADLNQSGYPDIVITRDQSLRIFPGGAGGPDPQLYIDLELPGSPDPWSHIIMQVHVADFNRDGSLDLLATVQTYDDKPETMARSTTIFWNSPEGFSSENHQVLPTYAPGQAHLADVDNDGYLDIVMSDKRGHIQIWHGGPNGYSEDRVSIVDIDVPKISSINSADLNGDGWLDLIASISSHYERGQESVYIFRGGPEGYSIDNTQKYLGGYTPSSVSVADLSGDGNLELIVSAYSSATARVLPMRIFPIVDGRVDFDSPTEWLCESACGTMAIDLNGNGYRDLMVACHRTDLGHQVDSLIFWNGPDGISFERTAKLPGLGPHGFSTRDPGNAYDREPHESYFSPPYDLQGKAPKRIEWDAEIPSKTRLRFQLRWSDSRDELKTAEWCGPAGADSYYDESGGEITGVPKSAQWIQYRAIFVSPNEAQSPSLRQVRIELDG